MAIVLGAAFVQKDRGTFTSPIQPRSNTPWARLYAALPLSFEANRGQTDPSVKFLSRGHRSTLFLTGQEAVLTLRNQPAETPSQKLRVSPQPSTTPDSVLRLRLVGANADAAVEGNDELPGKANYFLGNDPSKWRRNVPTYAKVRYRNLYPGVDLVYYGNQGGELEYDFLVAPGADPNSIALEVAAHGHSPLRIAENGDLQVRLEGGEISLHRPTIYQPSSGNLQMIAKDGPRTPVEGHYVLTAANQVRFALSAYDHTKPLVIDPVLAYATYVGGSGGDIGYGIAVDSSLDAYVAGFTASSNFPTSSNANKKAYGGNGDAFVFKMNSSGTALLYSTYVGGTGADTATAIAVSAGNAFITGNTNSTDFPIAPNTTIAQAFQTTYGGGATDAFVVQLDTTGSNLVYSSYLGGSGADAGQGIAVDSAGNAYVTGSTQSSNFTVLNFFQQFNGGSTDAFVTKVNFTGEAILNSTYLGGSQADVAQAIQVDTSSPPNIYLAGYTYSSNFPTAPASPLQGTIGGGADAFVAELKGDFSALIFSTYLGGSSYDQANGIALDSSGNVYVAGYTSSTNFPTVLGSYQTALLGSTNAFICKLNPAGSSLLYSTYLGGSGTDQANAIAVVPSTGVAFITGSTLSSNFPTLNPIQSLLGLSNNTFCSGLPCADAFVTQLNAAGNALTYSTYLGGNGPDFGQSIAVDSNGDPYITGSTSSTNFPAVSPIVPGTTYVAPYKSSLTGASGNAFVAKIDVANTPTISITPGSLSFGNETLSVESAVQLVTIVNPSTTPLAITSIQIAPIGTYNTIFSETDNCQGGTIPGGGGYCTMNVAFTPAYAGAVTDQITITDNAGGTAGTQQTMALSGTGVTAATAVTVAPTSLSFSNQNVGTVSPPQSVTITNTGTATLNITQISTSNSDFNETNTCAALLDTLAVGQSCSVSVTFSPTTSGTRSGSLTIADTAVGSPQTISLSGIGLAAFSLTTPSSSITVNPVLIGATQTTFLIEAIGSTSFNGSITLACSSGTTCAFSTNPIFIGKTSTMTVSNLTTSMPNPYNFSVTGTSGSQSTSFPVNLLFQDFTLSATPSLFTVQAGAPAHYTIIASPLNGFNREIQLSCVNPPPPNSAGECIFSTAQPTLNATSATNISLTINTVKYVVPTHAPPRYPFGKLPPMILGILSLLALASLALGVRRRAPGGRFGRAWLGVRLAIISFIMVLDLALGSCRQSTLLQSGTTTGNYTVTIDGTLVSNTAVVRTTTLNLSVTSSIP